MRVLVLVFPGDDDPAPSLAYGFAGDAADAAARAASEIADNMGGVESYPNDTGPADADTWAGPYVGDG